MHVTHQSDPLCHPFMEAGSEPEAERQLAHLLEAEAAPVIQSVFRRKLGRGEQREAAEDLASAVREELIKRLLRARRGEAIRPIVHFRNYVAAVAYSTWAERL